MLVKLVLLVLSLSSSGSSSCTEGNKRSFPDSCTTYAVCQDNSWAVRSCGPREHYDDQRSMCVQWTSRTCQLNEGFILKVNEKQYCEGFWKRPIKDDCGKYLECSYGVLYHKSCPNLMRFDNNKLECRLKWNADCKFKSECIEDQKKAVDYSCTGFERCVEGFWEKEECPFPKGFDYKNLECGDPQEAKCLPSNCTTLYRAVGNVCRSYDECVGGNYVRKKCPLLKRFDTVWHICRWKWSAISDCGVSQQKSTPSSAAPLPTTTGTTQTSGEITTPTPTPETTIKTTTPKQNFCPNGTVVPVPDTCKEYVNCDPRTGIRRKVKCKWCQNFEPVKLKCVWSWQYKCEDGGSTTAAPSCEEGERIPVDCKKYRECKGGRWEELSCSWGQHFDKNKLKCRIAWWAKC